MKTIVFDSSALVAYFYGQKGRDQVSEWLTDISIGEAHGIISSINYSEFLYVILRDQGLRATQAAERRFHYLNIHFAKENHQLALAAAQFRHRFRLGTADSFAAAVAQLHPATLLTGDFDFTPLKKIIRIEFI